MLLTFYLLQLNHPSTWVQNFLENTARILILLHGLKLYKTLELFLKNGDFMCCKQQLQT